MTEQLQRYLHDTYLFELTSTVLSVGRTVDQTVVVLADNLFHPQGGGQPDDRGTVEGVDVLQIRRTPDGTVALVLPPDLDVVEGGTARVAIDREARLSHAALHSAGHLVDGVLRQRQGLVHRTSNHFPGQARVEYAMSDEATVPDADTLRSAVQAQIDAALPITSEDSEAGRRVWIGSEYADLCGGTHVRVTAELAGFDIRSLKKKSGVLKAGYTASHRDIAAQ